MVVLGHISIDFAVNTCPARRDRRKLARETIPGIWNGMLHRELGECWWKYGSLRPGKI
jgi:hypothetical protein